MSENIEQIALATIYAKPQRAYDYVINENLFSVEDFTGIRQQGFIVFSALLSKYKTINYDLVFNFVQSSEYQWIDFTNLFNELLNKSTFVSALPELAKSLKADTARKKVLELSEELKELSQNLKLDSSDLSSQVFSLCSKLNIVQDTDPQSVFEVFKELLNDLKKEDTECEFVPTGYKFLDEKIKGLFKGGLNIIGARSGVGKSAFLANLVVNILSRPNVTKPCLLFSLEMPNKQVLGRLLSLVGKVPNECLLNKTLGAEHYHRMLDGIQRMANMKDGKVDSPKLYLDDSTGLSMGDLVSKCYKLYKQYNGLSLICVDYLQLMRTGVKSLNRTLEIAELTRQLKLLAKEFNCPVIALSQLNRSIEQRRDGQPQLSDLRESGAIEQDADLILFITRDTSNPNDTNATVHIAKNRNGETGSIPFTYNGQFFAFNERAYDYSEIADELD